MGFEAKVSFEDKQTALEMLVDNGVLTKSDLETCLRALKKEPTQKGVFYKDKNVVISYRGIEDHEAYNGKFLRVILVIENKTKEVLHVKARGSINGYIVENDATISNNIPEKGKIICPIEFAMDTLKYVDVRSLKDIENISFVFRVLDKSYKELSKSTKPAQIDLK